MGHRAYLLVKVRDDMSQKDFIKAILDLEDMLEIDFVDPVVGTHDMVISIEATVSVEEVAKRIRSKPWVAQLEILRIVSMFERQRSSKRELLKALLPRV